MIPRLQVIQVSGTDIYAKIVGVITEKRSPNFGRPS